MQERAPDDQDQPYAERPGPYEPIRNRSGG
jgi:hypothetical protein